MIHRLAFASASGLILAGCGTPPEQRRVDPATTEEAQALEDAASMLDEREAAPPDTQIQDNQTSGETR
ncbi:hypothetical protein E3U23_13140 [Erythrobacter litoralis]|uniref:hypothetical protein n=1 Tax=Erythrobacter litoralis TaxID=39960 RepID=UPI0024350E79|nr:hypothetical protein [Erythrobacter litoralis]MDG6080133.1 hypothetical protein [Erythrobacter litoralis]